jgi:hypothetical protein
MFEHRSSRRLDVRISRERVVRKCANYPA